MNATDTGRRTVSAKDFAELEEAVAELEESVTDLEKAVRDLRRLLMSSKELNLDLQH